VEFLEVGGVFLCSGRAETEVRIDCKVGVVAFIGKERGNTSCCARGVVKRELRKWKEFGPVVLLVITVDLEVLFQGLVCLFGLTVSFWVVARCEM